MQAQRLIVEACDPSVFTLLVANARAPDLRNLTLSMDAVSFVDGIFAIRCLSDMVRIAMNCLALHCPDSGHAQFRQTPRLESFAIYASGDLVTRVSLALEPRDGICLVSSLRRLHLKADDQMPMDQLARQEACEGLRRAIGARWEWSLSNSGNAVVPLEDLTISEALVEEHYAWLRERVNVLTLLP